MRHSKITLFFVSFLFILSSIGQVIEGTDFSKINIDNLSDDQISLLISRANLKGLDDSQLELKAIEAGFSREQASKLKERVAKLGMNVSSSNPANSKSYNRGTEKDLSKELFIENNKSKIFGADFFSNQNITFEPNLKIATPSNYVLGPGDKLIIDIYGYSEVQHKLEVSPDGFINVPNVGPIFVSGLSIEEARIKVKKQLSVIFTGINTGKTSFQMVLGEIRSINVMLIGEIMRPASYTLPSLATIANALYVSGGPSSNGSLRAIDLIRNGKKVTTFDFYDFLLHGDLTHNILLQDQDVIRVNPYVIRIGLYGAIKRPAIFEVKENENLDDVIHFSGGFADTANTELITVYRIADHEKEIVNIRAKDLPSFSLRTGDSIVVNGIINRFKNRISIAGAVFYAGNYSLKEAASLKTLINLAQLKENAFRKRGVIRRFQKDQTPSLMNFNIDDVLNGKQDIELQKEDSVHIYNIVEVREKYQVTINGEVNAPGSFDFADSMKLQDLVLMANGFKDGASYKRLEIARRIRSTENSNSNDSLRYAIVKILSLNNDMMTEADGGDFSLQPFDVISVRKSTTYKEQITVRIDGEVNYPGVYSIRSSTEKLSDLIQRAGGLKNQAYTDGAFLLRKTFEAIQDTALLSSKLKILSKQNNDTSSKSITTLSDQQKPVGIRLADAIQSPGSVYDIFLEEGDVLKVPRKLQTVQTFGAVNVSQKIVYREGIKLLDAIHESGGYARGSIKRRAYVIYANGEVQCTNHFLFFNFYPKIKPGTEIYVPAQASKTALTTAEKIGIASSIAGLGAIVIALLNFIK